MFDLSSKSPDAIAKRVEELATPVAAECGAEVYDVEVRRVGGEGVICLVVEKAGRPAPGEGITVGEVTKIAKEVGYLLDAEDFVDFSYRFEVSSPGIERHLRTERHAVRNVGERVRLTLRGASEGGQVVEGLLGACEDGVLTVTDDAGTEHKIVFDDVRRGRTVFDFDGKKQQKK